MAIEKKQTNQKSSRVANAVTSAKSQSAVNTQSKTQSQKNKIEKEAMPMGKMNYIMMAVSLLLIVVGFVLMSGSSNEGSTFNDDVFNSTRIVVAPMITLVGFLCMIPAILYRGKKENASQSLEEDNSLTSNVIVKDNN